VARHRRGRHGPSHRTVLVAGVGIGLVMGCGLVAAAAVPLGTQPPALALTVATSPSDGPDPALPFPSQGESAVAIPTLSFAEAHNPQVPVPIASLTKLMTAYVTLRAMPLAPDATGPTLVVEPGDVTEYRHELRAGDSSVKVVAGEALTERQLLDGLLVHSADNFAELLARLVVGSDTEMVARMNEAAAALGLHATQYADVSGLDPASRSSALDVLRLAIVLMRDPTFAQIVRQPSVVLPVAGEVTTFQPYLGKPGVVGIKTGTTLEALGCDVLAFDAKAAGHTVQIVAVVLGQSSAHFPLRVAAGRSALVLASGVAHHLGTWRLETGGGTVGALGWASGGVAVATGRTLEVPTFATTPATASVHQGTWPRNAVPAGEPVATITVRSGAYVEHSTVATTAALTRPSLWQRLR